MSNWRSLGRSFWGSFEGRPGGLLGIVPGASWRRLGGLPEVSRRSPGSILDVSWMSICGSGGGLLEWSSHILMHI